MYSPVLNKLAVGLLWLITLIACEQENILSRYRVDSSIKDLPTTDLPITWTFSDNFDRDNGSIGNGWVEIVEWVGDGSSSGIYNLQYRNSVCWNTSSSRIVRIARSVPKFKEMVTVEVRVRVYFGIGWPHNNDSLKLLLFADNVNRSGAATGIGFFVVGGDRSDTGDGAFRTVIIVDGVESSQPTAGNLHVWRQIDFVISNDTIKLYNYPSGDPRPDIPTISIPFAGYTPQFENIVAWFLCTQVGDNAAGTTIDDLNISITGYME